VEKLRRDILWLGYSRIIVRMDNKPAIVALLHGVLKALKVDLVDQAMPDHPPAYDSKANGSIENAVKQVQGILRTHLSCLQNRLQCKVPGNHPLMAWMVEHAAWTLTIRQRGRDGRTAYEHLKGRPFHKRMVGIGEICFAKLSKRAVSRAEMPKLAPRWTTAVFLGYHKETHEYIFHARGRIIRSRALQRVPPNARWSMRALEEVRASPYSLHRRPDEEAVIVPDPSLAAEQERRERELIRRDVALKRSDFEKHGYTGDVCHATTQYGSATTTTRPTAIRPRAEQDFVKP
jgi:hypothetical protein